MATVGPREALGYALSREMALLYGVVLAGYIGMILGAWIGASWAMRGGGGGFVGQILSAVLFLGGLVAVLAGIIGLVYKVIADANAVARA